MEELRHDGLTRFLVGACLLLRALAAAPRLLARPGAVVVEQPDLTVSIEGLVTAPGAYRLAFGARVADLVELAGGFRPGAARGLVALAAPLTDGEVVQVPAQSAAPGVARVSVNSASIDQLQTLPG